MAAFDLALGMNSDTMNAATQALYQKIYPQLFSGSQPIDFLGIQFVFSWDVHESPTFILSPPNDGEAILKAHLSQYRRRYARHYERMVQSFLSELEGNIFQMVIDKITVKIQCGNYSGSEDIQMSIIIQANSAGGKLSLVPIKAVGQCGNESDQWILNHLILPQAMVQVGKLLDGISLPALQFSGLSLTALNMIVSDQHIVGLANLAGKPVPQPPFPDTWPGVPFFALISDDAKLTIARANTGSINGMNFGKSGDIDIGIGDLYYNATVTLQNLQIANGGPNSLNFSCDITGNASAGIKIGCTNFGFNFNIIGQPNPTGSIGLQLSGNTLVATTANLNTFVLVLVPNGNPVEWILDILLYPLTQAIVAAFSPLISNTFNGISFSIWQIPRVSLAVAGTDLFITPTQIAISDYNGMMSLQGQANIS